MAKPKYMPGPWDLIWHGTEQYPYPLTVLAGDGGFWVARDGTVSSEANARLIAAAPDLLEALRLAEDLISATFENLSNGDAGEADAELRAIRAAIAKATPED